ncbi:uncharacterized protein LOC129321417 [Prosopis cineraria]|uniref:uncharacterized protein LOC129321417 n=1 Tax=Prosopis cineraria TaxID=364024 RepID=UPI00240FEA3A|nr:uncharacterized protein LOC129321417 [Prosopis cineraria]
MASGLLESTEFINLSNAVPLVGANYDLKLKRSIQDLLAEIRREAPNLSLYVDIFYQLVQAKADAPFEAIWVYASLSFRCRDFAEGDALDRILIAKDLFQLLSACSASSGASKCISLLVPVVFEVHRVILKLFAGELSVKREKKAMKEAKSLLDNILGYISVCCCRNCDDDHGSVCPNLIIPFTDLVNVWASANEEWESFLPLVSSDVCRWISTRVLDVGYLAAAVIIQAFLLKMCFSFHLAKLTDELENNLKSWAVSTISSFRNACFYEILMRTTLATPLPLSSILKPEDEVLLRKVLFDAVLLVEYPFLYQNAKLMQSLTLTRLIVTHVAVEYFRGTGDENRALSYGKIFSASRVPSQIVKWVKNQHNLEDKASRINGSSHSAVLKWLSSLEEDKGIEVFGDDFLRSRAKLGLDLSQAGHLEANLEGKIADDDLFYVDKTMGEENTSEEEEQNKLASAAFVAAAKTMKVTDVGKRKRKGKSTESKIKSVKYELLPDPRPVSAGTSISKDGSGGESEIDDPVDSDSQDTE